MNPPIHSEAIQTWLEAWLSTHQAVAGTVHVTHDGALHLAAHVNIPPPVRAAVALVPPGKGMAGLAMVRRQPVQTCNLQDDASGDVRPGARAVNAGAAVAIPVEEGGGVCAVVGAAFGHTGAVPEDRLEAMTADTVALRGILIR
ncbi:MAG: L-methionine (R)-S-oxide reductase [Myxococcota bacterium]|jgi:L-methionine (R)-S-oxide reductase